MKAPVVALLLLAAACTSHSAKPTTRVAPAVLPVVKESFTPLPCDDSTDTGEQGCLEKAVLGSDTEINARVKGYWDKADAQGKAKLAEGERAWLDYRASFCGWEQDQYRGGSAAAVVFAQCLADVTAQHAKDLRAASPED